MKLLEDVIAPSLPTSNTSVEAPIKARICLNKLGNEVAIINKISRTDTLKAVRSKFVNAKSIPSEARFLTNKSTPIRVETEYEECMYVKDCLIEKDDKKYIILTLSDAEQGEVSKDSNITVQIRDKEEKELASICISPKENLSFLKEQLKNQGENLGNIRFLTKEDDNFMEVLDPEDETKVLDVALKEAEAKYIVYISVD